MNKKIILIFFILTAIILKPYLLPFVAGLLLAIIFFKPFQMLEDYRPSPKFNALVVCGGAFLFLVIPLILLIIGGVFDLKDVLKNSPAQQFTVVKDSAMMYLVKIQTFLQDSYSIKVDLYSHVPKALEFVSRYSLYFGEIVIKAVPALIFNLIITFVTSFFMLLYSDHFKSLYLKLIPFPIEQTEKIAKIIQKVAESILLASVIASTLQAIIVGFAILITPFENITLWVFLAFILSFVPVIGTTPIVLFLIASAWINHDIYSLVVFVLMWGGLGLIDNLLKPLLIGNKANLNPFLAFLAALGGVSLVGFIGLFIGPILVGTFVEILRSEEAKPPVTVEVVEEIVP